MAERLFPADAVGGTPAYSGRGLRQLHTPFLAGATAARPFGALSGVRPGTSPATVTATATTWRCGLHAGVLDVQPAVEAGPYAYAVDEIETGSMAAADASNTRIDRIYVQLSDPAEANVAQTVPPSVTVRYLQGTPAAAPVAPALPARSMSLARITVPRQGGGAPTVTWEARGVPAAGGVVEYQTRAMLDEDRPPVGTLGRVVTTNAIFEYLGVVAGVSVWAHVAGRPDTAAMTPIGIYRPTAAPREPIASAQAGRVILEGNITSSIAAKFVVSEEYPVGKFPDAYGIKVARTFFVDANQSRSHLLVVAPDGTISFRPTSEFTAVLNLSIDGISWTDKRL